NRLAMAGVHDLLNEAYQLLYQHPPGTMVEPLRKLHSLLLIDEIGLIALPDLIQRKWNPALPEAREPEPVPADPPPVPEPPIDWSKFHDCHSPKKKPDTAPVQSQAPALPVVQGEQSDSVVQLQKLPVIQAAEEYAMDELLVVQ